MFAILANVYHFINRNFNKIWALPPFLKYITYYTCIGSAVAQWYRGAAGSCLTGVTALWSLSKTHLS